MAEFLGTGVLTLAVLSVQRSQLGLAYFVAIAAGLAVVMLTYVLGNTSGAHMNPALTLALWTARRVKTLPALMYIIVQLLGAWAAYGLYRYFVDTDVQQVSQAFSGRIMVAEAVGTMIFAFAWAAAAYNRYENSRFATTAGLAFAVAIIIASAASVGLANPALAVGVRAWEVFGENGWLNYALGPVLGAIIGVNLYGLLFSDTERSFLGGLRGRRSAAATAGTGDTASTSAVADNKPADDDDGDADEAEDNANGDADAADTEKKSSKKNKTVAATPAGATKVAKSKKTSTKKVSAKKKR
ncbi:MAG TPA: aquaporin [Candidatus Saccharimonadales bacterium]|nr:aquaporin [Candidatus Saccharimonadales bacterium]